MKKVFIIMFLVVFIVILIVVQLKREDNNEEIIVKENDINIKVEDYYEDWMIESLKSDDTNIEISSNFCTNNEIKRLNKDNLRKLFEILVKASNCEPYDVIDELCLPVYSIYYNEKVVILYFKETEIIANIDDSYYLYEINNTNLNEYFNDLYSNN